MRYFVFCALAVAASAAADPGRGPGDQRVDVPPPHYRSAFADYKGFREPDLADWREVNDEMGRLGGHKGHASAPKPQPAPQIGQPAQRAPAAAGGHAGHGGHR